MKLNAYIENLNTFWKIHVFLLISKLRQSEFYNFWSQKIIKFWVLLDLKGLETDFFHYFTHNKIIFKPTRKWTIAKNWILHSSIFEGAQDNLFWCIINKKYHYEHKEQMSQVIIIDGFTPSKSPWIVSVGPFVTHFWKNLKTYSKIRFSLCCRGFRGPRFQTTLWIRLTFTCAVAFGPHWQARRGR